VTAVARAFGAMARRARVARIRSMSEFAEAEIIIPNGPKKGDRFRLDTQPFARLWLEEIDSRRWREHWATGPAQTGKTLITLVIPLMFHLFEYEENCIMGIPRMEMASEKWRIDILPAIKASRYKSLLPTRGPGSKEGAKVELIKFRNGASLRFMSAHGGDENRSGSTARVVFMTEVDKMDDSGNVSEEANPIAQMMARTRAYGESAVVYGECTPSTSLGKIWQTISAGTASKIVLPCPACDQWVTPERENLIGFQEAENELEAEELAALCCPACAAAWSEEQRIQANLRGKLVHRGQQVINGRVVGELPKTRVLGFRWSATNNLFQPMRQVASKTWKLGRTDNEEQAERELNQFVWALPHDNKQASAMELSMDGIQRRQSDMARGVVPSDCWGITRGTDVGRHLIHYVDIAHTLRGPYVIDYGVIETNSIDLGDEAGIRLGLSISGQMMEERYRERQWIEWIDSGDYTDIVYEVVREDDRRRWAIKGAGSQQYMPPSSRTRRVGKIGEDWHVSKLKEQRVSLIILNSDGWKHRLHRALANPIGAIGALLLFAADPRDHFRFAKHMLSERRVEDFVAGRGWIARFVRERTQNHLLDAGAYAMGAGSMLMWMLGGQEAIEDMVREPTSGGANDETGEDDGWQPEPRTGFRRMGRLGF
jgi:phage terminase large subunit GpA-like protein